MDKMPLELTVEVLRHFDPFEIFMSMRLVCTKFYQASQLILRTTATLEGLPMGYIFRICSFLDTTGVRALSQVSTTFRKTIKGSPSTPVRARASLHPIFQNVIDNIIIQQFHGNATKVRVRLKYFLWDTFGYSHHINILGSGFQSKSAFWPPASKVVISYGSISNLLRPVIVQRKGGDITIRGLIEGIRMLFLAPVSQKQDRDTMKYKKFQDFLRRKCRADKEGLLELVRDLNTGQKNFCDIEGFKGFKPDNSPIFMERKEDNINSDMYLPAAVVDQRSLLKSRHLRSIDNPVMRITNRVQETVYLDIDFVGPLSYDV